MNIAEITHFLAGGLLDLPWWGMVLVVLGLTHITMAAVTIFLHRHQAHRALDLSPLPSHFFRFWLWMTTGMVTKQWAAIHRKHHARCETAEDPHSPQVLGLKKVLLEGSELYRAEAKNQQTMDKFGHGTPNDWLENKVYTPHSAKGVALMMIINLVLFGANGIWMWAIQMIWTPVFAAGVINGIGHYFGYRNFDCEDASTNIVPWGILIAGEELHNNHHTYGTSAKLSVKPWEFDIGWMYIRLLEMAGLAKVRKTHPKPRFAAGKTVCDEALLQAIIANRYEVITRFGASLKTTCANELALVKSKLPSLDFAKWQRLFARGQAPKGADHAELSRILEASAVLSTIHTMREELAQLWARSSASGDQLVAQLQDWCARAESSGIEALQQFSLQLRRYAMPA